MVTWQYLPRIHGMEWVGTNMAHIRERKGVQSLMDTLIVQEGRPQSSGNCEASTLETVSWSSIRGKSHCISAL